MPEKFSYASNTKLAKLLERKHISQKMLIALIENKTKMTYTKAQISNWVNGKNKNMKIETALIIAYSLGCDHLEEIIDGFPIKKSK
jgi:transcriptional regulator with XRE-family HTH domain